MRWLGLALAAATAASALTARVDPAGGAPRIVIDGQAVRARVFWGGPGSRPVTFSEGGGWVEETFIALADEPRIATMHLRFGQTPGSVTLDDIQLTDLETGANVLGPCDFEGGLESLRRDWTSWPTGAQNTVAKQEVLAGVGRDGSAGWRVTLTAPADKHWPDWHAYHQPRLALVKGHRYRLRLWAQAQPARDVKIAFYRPGNTFVYLGGPGDIFAPQIRLAAAAEVPFVSFPVGLPWPQPGQSVNWATEVDAAIDTVLGANPRALLWPRIPLDAPAWWCAAHPDECMRWDTGTHRAHACVASPLYRQEALARLRALVEHLEERYPDRVAGYHPAGQNTGEWFYEDTWQNCLNGYAPADAAGFARWQAERAPGRPAFAVPSAADRRANPGGTLREPVAEAAILAFNQFQQESMASWVCELARCVKQACGGRKLSLFFYGYVFEFGPITTGPPTSGHYALRRALDCPDIDILCSPISYFDRGAGQGAPSMTAAESVALAGKLWLNEDDTHTYLAREPFPGSAQHVTTQAETIALLQRNVAQEAARGFGTWWMDLGSSGWFNDAGLWAGMKRFKPLDDWFLAHPTPYRPALAAVIDEPAMQALSSRGSRVSAPGVYEARAALGRCGVPYGQYLQDDVAAGKVGARVLCFLTPWRVNAAQRAQLRSAARGKVAIWCYAPGYLDGDTTNVPAMADLTGFKLAPIAPQSGVATPTVAGQRLGLTQPLGTAPALKPQFAATDATGDEVLATWADGSAAIALRTTPTGTSIFCGTAGLSSELLRAAARLAGAHVYTQVDANVYANGPLVAVHADHDGAVELDLGVDGPVVDALSGATVGAGPKLTLELRKGDTRVLRTQAGGR